MKIGGPRDVFVRWCRGLVLRSACWIVRKLGHPWGGPYGKGVFVCLECGETTVDTVMHRAQQHGHMLEDFARGEKRPL